MSGHSKWASIKHKKAAIDAKRGKLFSRFSKEITVAAKMGGGDIDMNPRLRTAVAIAKAANMPNDNIDKAIKKGTGELPGVVYEECVYEGYGPSGVAILIEVMTDNKNRTTAEIRSIFTKRNGNMASANAVAWMFEKKGFLVVSKSVVDEEKLLDVVLEAGAEDVKTEGDTFEIYTSQHDFETVKEALAKKGIATESAEITAIPNSTIKLTAEKDAKQILDLIEVLEDHDDVQNVYANFDIPDDIMAALE
ncbi:MAG: YebC/PmpR family DNA-binding transcriptional regulator [Candidatus Auribacter fodinae]|uniref:Probable transcriptional regulatory protein C4541_10575 n=1 Tax=Candidatus Auribacter fodinae TaxID=2093366 RepID=A0A3A4QYS7_9BACT|nr:MAG: YebC/PmpR family DNA-binding transcriptional regulator [Candidatus Auribacter fodinae]